MGDIAMIRYHCDVEGCASMCDDGGTGSPTGWATVSWMGSKKNQVPDTLEAMKDGLRAGMGDEPPRVKGARQGPAQAMLATLEAFDPGMMTVSCQVLICPTCLSERLPLGRFVSSAF